MTNPDNYIDIALGCFFIALVLKVLVFISLLVSKITL